jgi:hypothetical protein
MQPSPSGRTGAAVARKSLRALDDGTIVSQHLYHHLQHRYDEKRTPPPQFKPPVWVYVFLVLPNDVLDPYLTRAKKPPLSSWGPARKASHSATRPRISEIPQQLPTTNGYPRLFRHQRAHSIHFTMSTQRISFLVGNWGFREKNCYYGSKREKAVTT